MFMRVPSYLFLHMLAKWGPTEALMKASQCTPDLPCHCFKRTHLFTSVVDSYSVSMGAAMDEMRISQKTSEPATRHNPSFSSSSIGQSNIPHAIIVAVAASSSSSSSSSSSCLKDFKTPCMDASQWPQGMGLVKPMEEFAASSNITTTTNSSIATRAQGVERRPRPNKEQALNCPRCNSTNTKFCYYNNYSLTQPRYFCKTCRRYWTEGGSRRNVPVGGGSRKNKRSSSSIISSSSAAAATSSSTATAAVATTASTSKELHLDDGHFIPPYKIPKFQYEGQDLNLAFPQQGIPDQYSSYPNNPAVGAFSSMGLLNRPFMPLPEYATGFGMLQELRPPTLNFPVGHGIVGGGEGGSGSGNTGKMLFPMEELKPVVPTGNETAEHFEQSKGQGGGDPPGYWNGISW